jgi:hypothetical protein
MMRRDILHTCFTIDEMIREAQRELELRRQCYWPRVRDGKMRADDAERRIALMEAIVKRLTATAAI